MNEKTYNEAYLAGCTGLVGGFAKKKSDNRRISAREAHKKDGPFYCGECYSDAVVRKCRDKRDHFAHKARLSPVCHKGETDLHNKCKNEICEILKKKFPDGKWEVERPIKENKEKNLTPLVPDISGRIRNIPIVIEIQASVLSLDKIIKRTVQYKLRKCAILWIIPLKEPLGDEPFRPRQFEKYLHSMYYGRAYYWNEGDGTLIKPVHYGMTERYIEESHWFEEDGTERHEGGYSKKYKTIKTPIYGRNVDIAEDFEREERGEFIPESNEKKAVPECIIYKDKLKHWWDKE